MAEAIVKLTGIANQQNRHPLYRADGSIVTGGTPQLVIGRRMACSYFMFQNTSPANLMLEIGNGIAVATLTNGAVTALTFSGANLGFNYTKPPLLRFWGGGAPQSGPASGVQGPNTSYLGLGQPNAPSPPNPATAICTISGGVINGYAITNPGSGYVCAPYVEIIGSDLDPNGCAVPSATQGIVVAPGAQFWNNVSTCTTDPIAVWGASAGQPYVFRWMD